MVRLNLLRIMITSRLENITNVIANQRSVTMGGSLHLTRMVSPSITE